MCRKRVLYVEDNKCSQVLVKTYLDARGFKVDTADDVYQALMRLIYKKYDAIILDYRLPMFTPDEAEHALRKACVPICYYTCDPEMALEAHRHGIPIINKMDKDSGGLKGLECVLAELITEPLPDDYDKTRHITDEELEAIRTKPSATVRFSHPTDDERNRFEPEQRELHHA